MKDGYNNIKCIDAGTNNCPCELACTGDCLVCSRLQGLNCCDCMWQGVCVYNEYMQGGMKAQKRRVDRLIPIRKKIKYSENIFVIVLDVGRGFAIEASQPGSYIFARAPQTEKIYDTPLSVMRSEPDKGLIHLLVGKVSTKTKRIIDCDNSMLIRGVYSNGYEGIAVVRNIKKTPKRSNVLIVARGTAAAGAFNMADWIGSSAYCKLKLDCSSLGDKFVQDYMPDNLQDSYNLIDLENDYEQAEQEISMAVGCDEYTSGRGIVVIATSDYYADRIGEITTKHGIITVKSNNYTLCCGEGICGGCCTIDANGNCHKMCKCQIDNLLRT